MPKIYSEDERAYIKKRLREEATYCLFAYGVKRTTVDELTRRVSIPKGTFYLFYESKELLLFEVLHTQDAIFESQILEEIAALKGNVTVDNLTELLFRSYKAADESGILKLLTTGEVELLYRKLPPAVLQEHFAHDNDLMQRIVAALNLPEHSKIDALSTAFRNLFMTMIYKRELGEAFFDDALTLTLRGLVMQLLSDSAQ